MPNDLESRTSWIKPLGILVLVLALANAGLLGFGLSSEFVDTDEVRQLPAGVMNWQTGSFSLANDSPPLARMVATMPALFLRLNTFWYDLKATDIQQDSSLQEREGEFCSRFVSGNRHYLELVRAARMTNFAWWLLGAWAIGRWSLELHGKAALVLSLCLWSFSSNVLAQEQVATGSFPAAVACLVATDAFRRYLKCPSWGRSLAAGFLFGTAQLVDYMALILAVAWPLLAVVYPMGSKGFCPIRLKLSRYAGQVMLMLLVGLWVVDLGYGFQKVGFSLRDFDFVSRSLGADPRSGRPPSGGEPTGNRFGGSWPGGLIVPVPADYLEGLDRRWHGLEEVPGGAKGTDLHPSRLRDTLPSLVAKIPIGISVMVLWSFTLLVIGLPGRSPWSEEVAPWLPVATVLAMTTAAIGLLSAESASILMAPFVAVISGRLACSLRPGHRLAGTLVVGLCAWAIGGSLATYPHPRAYLNEAAGGPGNFAARMRHGPSDGGRDLRPLKEWLRTHPEVQLRGMAVRNLIGPELTRLRYPPPLADPGGSLAHEALRDARRIGPGPGYFALDPEHLEMPAYGYFRDLEPITRVGSSIYLYRITPEDTARLRAGMGWPAADAVGLDVGGGEIRQLYRTFADTRGEVTNYAIFVPAGYRAERPYPLIMLLHGYGDRGTTGRQFTKVGVPTILKSLEGGFSFLVLVPQGRSGSWQVDGDDARRAMELLAAIEKEYRVDPARIYLTGISSGGTGVWDFAARYPDRWAAIVPTASSGDPGQARSTAVIPCWCFHNSHDAGTPVANPRRMIEALRRAGGTPKYTEFFGLEHNCWDRAYSSPDLYDWMLRQKRP